MYTRPSGTPLDTKWIIVSSNSDLAELISRLPLNVIRNYNLRIVDRMLKEIRNNRMLKSKSEIAVCYDFASWLIKFQKDNFTDKKIVLVFFEPRHSKILQLFQALERYRLHDDVNKILLGCVNGWDLLRQQLWLITTLESTPLWRALFNVLNQALHKILRKVHGGRINTWVLKENLISCDHLLEQVKKIKEELTKEAQWRPVFADIFHQGIKPRRRAGFLRHMLVESGITYAGLTETFKDKKDDGVVEVIKENIKGKNEADVEEPDKPVRRGSGRRAPRTCSLCTATYLEKQQPAFKIEPEENNNDPVKVSMDVIPSTPAVLSEAEAKKAGK
ncbi:hypothetical protein DAPPUDRAFT_247552 [Daphnia pulex]|uniref:Uncharacterized protein n=1 Tax=Daphnia pulex TaxID=6669 RepID=E9GSP2_DAPPU|nr:hypothetical protein DAPPUDRAFT_247552 [Daphnia pulex]|eukprot:EFX77545.1 hypothetical protein DAPPUDRAFT_247552 [Daphnia pulex]